MAHLLSYRRQNLLLEFAALKHVAPLGVYATITPGDPSRWTGVMFVRKGPYAPAVLRFSISFPAFYPDVPPVVVFNTDLFHPLLKPLTMSSYNSLSSGAGAASADELLPPGGFSLRYGFPDWFLPGGYEESEDVPSAIEVLVHVRKAFENEGVLDSVPVETAVNEGAWYAWQAHRAKGRSTSSNPGSPPSKSHTPRKSSRENNNAGTDIPTTAANTSPQPRRASQWKWEGVWEERVKRALQSNVSAPVLFGSAGLRDEDIHFTKLEPEQIEQLQTELHKRFETTS